MDRALWPRPEARDWVLTDLRRGALGVQPSGWPAIVHIEANWPADDAALGADALLAELLVTLPAYPYWLEERLTALRRRLLLDGVPPALKRFAPVLAIQCFLNEYAWAADPVELEAVARMAADLPSLDDDQVMMLACYRPLCDVPGADSLTQRGWTGRAAVVLEDQLLAVQVDRQLAQAIPALTPIAAESDEVRGQYEANPYPRWRVAARIPVETSIKGRPLPPSPDVLFAGCGTGLHAIQAGQRYGPQARILAIDLSRASLAYGLRKARQYGLAQMQFAQADLLELDSLCRDFDVIESSGVLHHLDDPFEGARLLARRLRPGGLMKLGLYSRIARERWAAAKALARTFSADQIPQMRRAIATARPDDPVRGALSSTDFYASSSVRDLLMHVREHELDISDLQRIVDETGLEFLGFVLPSPVLRAYGLAWPDDPRGVRLENWAAFERANPRTFVGMYQFWLQRPQG